MSTFLPNLSGRTAVVTGAASGIGRATAILLARHGARVFAADFDPIPANETVFFPLGIRQVRCDVRHESEIRELLELAGGPGDELHILVNNAGVGMVKQITEVTEEDWDKCLGTNLKAAFFAAKYAVPLMREAGGGAIVNVSSNAGILPRAHDPVYSISKGALNALTKSLALCHAADKIRVNAVCPGPVGQTRMMDADLDSAADREALSQQMINASPLARAHRRMISPEEIAEAILYLVSDAAAMVTGTMLAIDGGKSLGVPPR